MLLPIERLENSKHKLLSALIEIRDQHFSERLIIDLVLEVFVKKLKQSLVFDS